MPAAAPPTCTHKPVRLQRPTPAAGWTIPDGAAYAGPRSRWRNPYVAASHANTTAGRATVTLAFHEFLRDRHKPPPGWTNPIPDYPDDDTIRAELGGRNLVCTCPIGEPCHVLVLLAAANPRGCTPNRREGTVTTFTVQRCCNGCGQQLGDATEWETVHASLGLGAFDVRDECPTCALQLPGGAE